MANVVIQVVATAMLDARVLFRWLGLEYDAAVTDGGLLGFGLSSMPALAGSIFVDLANASMVKAFLILPWFH